MKLCALPTFIMRRWNLTIIMSSCRLHVFGAISTIRLMYLVKRGHLVPDGFEYNSGTNPHFLTVEELKEMNS